MRPRLARTRDVRRAWRLTGARQGSNRRGRLSPGQTRADLLQEPAVAVRVAELGEGAVARPVGRRPGDASLGPAAVESTCVPSCAVENLADHDAVGDQLDACRIDVRDDQVQVLRGAWGSGRKARAELDRAGGARGSELDQAEVVTGDDVGV